MTFVTRRGFVHGLGGGALATAAGLSVGVSFAAAALNKRLVVVLLRGGLDGLAAVPPYGDANYRSARGGLALQTPGADGTAIQLDGLFALHPALKELKPVYDAGELAIIHATGLAGYSGRSHFDAQNILETGARLPRSEDTGWLNRALGGLKSAPQPAGLAVAQSVPLILYGPAPYSTWAPSTLPAADEDFLMRVAMLYDRDPALREALSAALDIRMVAGGGDAAMDGNRRARTTFPQLVKGAAALLKAETGPRLAVLDVGGWDTHANQGAEQGQLANRLRELAQGLVTLKIELGPLWRETAVVVVTEFGRTVAPNGSKGTDHGTGGVAFVLGGSVSGGKIHGDWPGLARSALFEGRDLKIATPIHAIFKAALIDHARLDRSFVDGEVLPEAKGVLALPGLFKT